MGEERRRRKADPDEADFRGDRNREFFSTTLGKIALILLPVIGAGYSSYTGAMRGMARLEERLAAIGDQANTNKADIKDLESEDKRIWERIIATVRRATP